MATMEFLQQEWINNGIFMSLREEFDPDVGLHERGTMFTIPQKPVRRRIHGIETFNVLRGGEYFFMPSRRTNEGEPTPSRGEVCMCVLITFTTERRIHVR
jgi:hypothetical protein